MKVTVCELSDNEIAFKGDWKGLKFHLNENKPDLLLLPEMPFSKWIASEIMVTDTAKRKSVEKHEAWMLMMEELNAKLIVYSKPVISGGKFYNTAFVFQKGVGHFKIHTKSFFPEEPHFWEQTWFDHEDEKTFELLEIDGKKIGVLLCTEMWFTQYARHYGKQGIDILLCPRATGRASVDQWIRCGQTLSIISGAYCLSSNRSGTGDRDFQWGGSGWIAEPMNGNLLCTTSPSEKFMTREIDINKSRSAKNEYPLYVKE
ncbi:MAG TPA: carbon-nitrogen hydrolase family protein [Chitinophagaceae bacterium]|nr:carbon-nitrogen hydrolase family protein [Chitinophagaceae bacterium]